MKKVIKVTLISIFSLFILSIFSNVQAASASISANKTNVKVGEKVTITVTMNAAAWNTKITGAQTKNFAGNSDSGENITKKEQVSFTPTSAGSFTINLSGDVSDGTTMQTTDVSGSVTIKVSEATTTTTTNNNNNNNNNNNKPATTTEPKEPTFKSANETMYATGSINIRKSYNTDSDILGKLKEGESVTRTGVGDNGWSKVTYNGVTGYIKSSLLTTEEPKKSSDKSLKSLVITPEGLDPEFNPEVTSYTLNVGLDVEKLDIKTATNDENARVEITGNDSLKPGDNVVKITVTAQDETTRIYNINVKKEEKEELGLSSLKIDGYNLSPKFASNIYEYKINILDPSITKLDITPVANDEKATVEISGNSDFKEGQNTVTITLTSEDGLEKVTYQIYVNKSTSTIAGTTNNKNNMKLYIGIGLIAIIIIIMAFVIIKSRRKKYYEEDEEATEPDDYSDLYGYTSKAKTTVNEEITPKETIEDSNFSKNDLENELFGKMPITNNITDYNEKNEDESYNYNQYTTPNIYENYNDNTNTESNSIYQNLYKTIENNEDFSFREPVQAKSIYDNIGGNQEKTFSYNNFAENQNKSSIYDNILENQSSYRPEDISTYISEDSYKPTTTMAEMNRESEQEDNYTIDDNYKIRRSKGKHSK